MIRRNGIRPLCLVLLCLVATGGCNSICKKPFCDRRASGVAPATIDIGGFVQNSGRVAIPEQGLTLQRALTLAGSRNQTSTVAIPTQSKVENPVNKVVAELTESARTLGTLNVQAGLTSMPANDPYATKIDGKTSAELSEEARAAAANVLPQA